MEQIFKMQSVIKKVDEEKRQVTSIISTETPDRDNDVIELKGWDLKNYKKNPVVLWGHNYNQPPIARTIKIVKENTKKELIATREYPAEGMYPFADIIFNLVAGGFQSTVSVGFKPSKWERRDQLPENHAHYVEGHPEEYYSNSGVLFQKQELLEYSDVPVPANPEALNLAFEKGLMDKKTYEELNKIPCYKCPKATKGLCTPDKNCMDIIKGACASGSNDKSKIFKGWANNNECEIVNEEIKEMTWTREKALKSLIGYEENGLAFAWKSGKGNSSKDFKLVHHYVEDHELKVSYEGVKSALEVMSDGRSKHIPAEDREEVYNHLADHAKELGFCCDSFEKTEESFKADQIKSFEETLSEKIDDLARKLEMKDSTPEEVLTKAYDAIVSKAVVVKFASLEPAVTALEADFKTISLDGKTIDDEQKALFKRLVDITAIVTEKELTGHTDEPDNSSDSIEEPTEEEATNKEADNSFLDDIDKAFDDVEKPEVKKGHIEEAVEKALELLHKKDKPPEELDDLFKGV